MAIWSQILFSLLFFSGTGFFVRHSRHSWALRLLQYVRDEAHRFAQHYHHMLRRRSALGGPAHSGATKAHDWMVSVLGPLFGTAGDDDRAIYCSFSETNFVYLWRVRTHWARDVTKFQGDALLAV